VVTSPAPHRLLNGKSRAWAHPVLAGTGRLLDYWHLLSLDAPTVAVVWASAFAKAAGVYLPWRTRVLLALATWLLYVTDRLLDSAKGPTTQRLCERHFFHQRHRRAFLSIAVLVLMSVFPIGLHSLDAFVFRREGLLAICAATYLFLVHFPRRDNPLSELAYFPRIPKEMLVGLIFSAACVLASPLGSHLPITGISLPFALFALLCWLNCVAIEAWENEGRAEGWGALEHPRSMCSNPSTVFVGKHLRAACWTITFIALLTALAGISWGRHGSVFWPSYGPLECAVAISAVLLLWLDRCRPWVTPLCLRALADAVLLTPLLIPPILAAASTWIWRPLPVR